MWGVFRVALIVASVAGPSSIATAEDVKPQPGLELSLEERGPCSVIECPKTVERRDIRGRDWWCKNTRFTDPRRADCLLRLSHHYQRQLRVARRNIDRVNARLAVALAPEPAPSIERSLEERGPCSVVECASLTPEKRERVLLEIAAIKRVLRNADNRPKNRQLIRLHELLTELINSDRLALASLRAQIVRACANN